EVYANTLMASDVRDLQEALRLQLGELDARGRQLRDNEDAYAARQRTLSEGEGAVAAGRAANAKEDSRIAAQRTEVDAAAARLSELEDRVERDQAGINDIHRQLLALLAEARAHEKVV